LSLPASLSTGEEELALSLLRLANRFSRLDHPDPIISYRDALRELRRGLQGDAWELEALCKEAELVAAGRGTDMSHPLAQEDGGSLLRGALADVRHAANQGQWILSPALVERAEAAASRLETAAMVTRLERR